MTDYTEDTVPDEQREAFWPQHLEAWKTGGQTQRAYCQTQDLTAHRFTYRKNRLAAAENSALPVPSGWRLLGHRELDGYDIRPPTRHPALHFTRTT